MLERMVRKLLKLIGLEEVSDQDVIRFIRFWKLDKLPGHYVFMLISVFPVIELVGKKLSEETIDWSDLKFDEDAIQN
tara:strand:+ start:14 stop:244 length:231 start_codon:yes stop_codon:yes gene_type:complete